MEQNLKFEHHLEHLLNRLTLLKLNDKKWRDIPLFILPDLNFVSTFVALRPCGDGCTQSYSGGRTLSYKPSERRVVVTNAVPYLSSHAAGPGDLISPGPGFNWPGVVVAAGGEWPCGRTLRRSWSTDLLTS